MIQEVTKLFSTDKVLLNFKSIKKALRISRKHKDNELRDVLAKLELDGLIYCDESDMYQKMPSNFFVTQVEFSTRGFPYIYLNGKAQPLQFSDIEGINPFDIVIFTKMGRKFIPKKVLKRNIKELICEVKLNEDNQKYLEVCNLRNKIKVRIDSKNMKKLTEGQRVEVELSTEKYDDSYEGIFKKVIGHRNDLDTELTTIAFNNGFLTEYPEEIEKELENIPDEVLESDLEGRIDKRNDKIFTIDGAHTKDIDDAIEIKLLPNGNYKLIVSIAHVSHYVKQDSSIWRFAESNTTSLYLVDHVMAMLHTKLSNGICSLNPGVDRLARTFEMEINSYGDVVDFTTYKSVIHSKKKMTYDDVNKVLAGETIPGYEEFSEDIFLLHKLSNILSAKKDSKGAIDFANKELEFYTDSGEIKNGINAQGNAQKIIENCMVLTNVCVGKRFTELLIPFVYRNHEFPITDKVKEIYHFLCSLGYRLEKINFTDDARVIQRMIKSLSNKEEFVVLSVLILQSMKRAYYSKDNRGHFGLAEDYYSQSTSPIRRFLDLVIHTIIDSYEDLEHNLDKLNNMDEYLDRVCSNATFKERCADKAEYEANQLYMVKSMEDKIGQQFFGFISNITSSKISIKTTDLFEGICPFNPAQIDYTYQPESRMLLDKRGGNNIHIGSKVKVLLKEIDLAQRQLIFEITEIDLEEVIIRTRKKHHHHNDV